jgi:DNA polymerase I-like protein with 3'-5' exonuclease and polymerase domains
MYYATMYGCSGPKLAKTLGLPEFKGDILLERFWDVNPGTKELKDNLESFWNTKGQKKWLPAIDGRRLITRKKSALLNTIFQSCGGIAMDYACCFMDKWLGPMYWDRYGRPFYKYKGCVVRRIGYYHDELEFECEEPVAEEVSKMIEKAITKAGEFLKLEIPLAGEGKTGKTWKDVH